MIATKLIFQSLGAVAVGGTVVSGAAYKINSDNEFKKEVDGKKTEFSINSELINKFKKELNDLNVVFAEKTKTQTTKEEELATFKQNKTRLESEINALEKEIKTLTTFIEQKESEKKSLKDAETNHQESLRKAKEEVVKKTQSLSSAKNSLEIKNSELSTLETSKKEAEKVKTTSETAKNEDDKNLKTLENKLKEEQAVEKTAQAAYDTENSKNTKPACKALSSNPDGEIDQNNCTKSDGTAINAADYKDESKVAELKATLDSEASKVKTTEPLINAAKQKASASLALFNEKDALFTTANNSFIAKNAEKTNAQKEVKKLESELTTANSTQSNAQNVFDASEKKHQELSKTLVAEIKEKTLKTKNKETKAQKLNETTASISNTELIIEELKKEIEVHKADKSSLENKITTQETEKTKLQEQLKVLAPEFNR